MYVCKGIYVDRVVLGERFDRLIEKLTIAKEEAGRLLYVYVCMYVCMDCMYGLHVFMYRFMFCT